MSLCGTWLLKSSSIMQNASGMPSPTDAKAANTRPWNVFVSSTVRDLEVYRDAVSDDLSRYAEAACFLSEKWVGGLDDTVEKCRVRVHQSDAFMLILGYWYGSIPTGASKSITQIEFETALEKWPGHFPPVAVMRPREPSDAHDELDRSAKTILDELEQTNGFDRAEHDRKRMAFHDAVVTSWRTVNQFGTRDELTKQAITCALRWQGKTPTNAAAGLVAVDLAERSAAITDADLGRLGRDKQLAEVNGLLALLAAERESPGVAMVVHGGEDAGLAEFLAALATSQPALKHCRPGSLPRRHSGLPAISSWAAQALGLQSRDAITTPEALADATFVELKRGPLGFILGRIALLDGGLDAFSTTFWIPFHSRLRQLAGGQPFQHQVVIVVSHVSADATVVGAATNPLPAEEEDLPDYSRPIRLSRLEDIGRKQLLLWLAQQDVPESDRAALADAVLKDDSGMDDRVPSRVLRRLKDQWPNQETSR
jgi:hypothetical protein